MRVTRNIFLTKTLTSRGESRVSRDPNASLLAALPSLKVGRKPLAGFCYEITNGYFSLEDYDNVLSSDKVLIICL